MLRASRGLFLGCPCGATSEKRSRANLLAQIVSRTPADKIPPLVQIHKNQPPKPSKEPKFRKTLKNSSPKADIEYIRIIVI